jgi:hypothetical protein
MKAVLEILKTHLISLICGVVALLGVAVALMGMTRKDVVTDMEKMKGVAGQISSLRSSAKNQELIDQEKRRGEAFKKEFADTIEIAKRINKREPLMSGIFPQPASAGSGPLLKFREEYARELAKLPAILSAETLPTADEVNEAAQDVDELRQLETEKAQENAAEGEGSRSPVAAQQPPQPAGNPRQVFSEFAGEGPRGGGRDGRGGRGGTEMSGAGQQNVEPKYNPLFRAQVAKARSILCYMNDNAFDVHPMRDAAADPKLDEMWYAQVSLWIQQDVARAIAAFNKEAVARVQDDVCVEHVPVKRLVSLRVLGYALENNKLHSFGGQGDSAPSESFTGRFSNEQFDVVRFDLVVVVDQRELLRLIDAIGKSNFYKCVGVAYEKVDHERDRMEGYFYGLAPVIRVKLNFEGYMSREIFEEMKPEAVRTGLAGKPATP